MSRRLLQACTNLVLWSCVSHLCVCIKFCSHTIQNNANKNKWYRKTVIWQSNMMKQTSWKYQFNDDAFLQNFSMLRGLTDSICCLFRDERVTVGQLNDFLPHWIIKSLPLLRNSFFPVGEPHYFNNTTITIIIVLTLAIIQGCLFQWFLQLFRKETPQMGIILPLKCR